MDIQQLWGFNFILARNVSGQLNRNSYWRKAFFPSKACIVTEDTTCVEVSYIPYPTIWIYLFDEIVDPALYSIAYNSAREGEDSLMKLWRSVRMFNAPHWLCSFWAFILVSVGTMGSFSYTTSSHQSFPTKERCLVITETRASVDRANHVRM